MISQAPTTPNVQEPAAPAGNRDYRLTFKARTEEMSPAMANATVHNTANNLPTVNEISSQPAPTPAPNATAPQTATARPPPPYRETSHNLRTEGQERQQEEDERHESECHPFWTSWSDMARGIGLIMTGALKIPFVLGHGIAKILWYIPVLYGDDTIWEWPNITGFPSSCKASVESLWYGILNGATDWLVLPYKGARKEGVAGFFKGFGKGVANMAFKPAAGGAGFMSHPFFGIYKEASRFKFIIKHDRHSRKKIESPV